MIENNRLSDIDIKNNSEKINVKLPKKVTSFIDDIEVAIREVNNQKQNVDLVVKDIYSKKDNGMVYLKNKEVEINRLIGLGCKDIEEIGLTEVREYYRLIIRTQIFEHINELNNYEINFDKQKLIETLKQIKHEGGKISIGVNKSNTPRTRSIAVQPKNTSITEYKEFDCIIGFEKDFMSVAYNLD
ncbi:hypothetical protein BS756_00695 [Staphylococcus sp. MB371]|nr:hypothetical protein BS756_00695 [Staphylococcus sp. MB371]